MINLTEIWRSCGEPKSKNVGNWAMGAGKNIIAQVYTNTGTDSLLTKTGSKGGTWATAPIALAYAKWLSEDEYCLLISQLFGRTELFEEIQDMTEQELVVYILTEEEK